MTERIIADSPSDGWSIGLVMSDAVSPSTPPAPGTTLTGIHIIGPTTFAFITLHVVVNGSAFQRQINKGVDQTFPVSPPLAIQTGLGRTGSGWKIAGVTDQLQVFDPNGALLVSTSA